MQAPPASAPDVAAEDEKARRIVGDALARGASWLDQDEIRELLGCYGIPTVRSSVAATAEDAARLAGEFGGPVALKIRSPDITHKSDVGGVALDLEGPEEVRRATRNMRERVSKRAPRARLDGFTVQEMIRRPLAHELIAGMAVDRTFGPFLLFGHGGTAVEVIGDRALALPPLNLALARQLMSGTRIFRQLQGYRDRPPADLDAVARSLVRLSNLVCDLDEVVEIDLNPLLADEHGVVVLDARVRIAAAAAGARHGARLAIPAYPKELERHETLPGIGAALLRPIRPEDAPGIIRLFESLSAEDVRLRFFGALRQLSPELLTRLTQIDYDRQMALVLEAGGEILGVARLAADPDNREAEFAVTVRTDLKGRGIGSLLMRRLLEHARRRGIGRIVGDILQENTMMLALARDLDFRLEPRPDTPGVVRASLSLEAVAA
jgi:acetyltransferase